jgi:acyl phosphate:glycerol-3-phosphate acyltransferase
MIILLIIFSYLLGAFPTGYLVYLITEKQDIRQFGSGNIGATNVLRLLGWKKAIPVIFADILKGAIPTLLALNALPDKKWALLCGFAAVLGHCFPLYLKFRGGKGMATTIGVYAVLDIPVLLIMLGVFFLLIVFTRYVSLGTLAAALSFPAAVLFLREDIRPFYLGLAVLIIIAIQHRGNIKRLIKGNERKLGEKKT